MRGDLSGVGQIVILLDPRGAIVGLSRAAARWLGRPADELIGLPLEDLLNPVNRAALQELVQLLVEQDAAELELALDTVPCFVSAARGRRGEVELIAVVQHDELPESKQAPLPDQRLRYARRMEVLGKLMFGVAHRFNNVLAAILASIDWIKGEVPGALELSEALNNMEQAVDQAKEITQSMSMLTTRDQGGAGPVDLDSAVRRSIELLRRIAPTGVNLVVHSRCEAPLWVDQQPSQLHQMLLDVIISAHEAHPEGCTLHVTIGQGDAGLGTARLGFRLDGPERAQHGEPRARPAGLEPAEAWPRTLELPVVRPAQPRPAQPRRPTPGDLACGGGQWILLAEDERYIRKIIASDLRALGRRVVEVDNGQAMIECHQRHRDQIGLLMVDLVLPGRGGLEALEVIRESAPETPAIVITGMIEPELEDRLDARTVLLRKPFTMEQLRALLDGLLNTDQA